jgi:hypothetical protein
MVEVLKGEITFKIEEPELVEGRVAISGGFVEKGAWSQRLS